MRRGTELLRAAAGRPGDSDLEVLPGAAAAAWPDGQGPVQTLRFETGRLTLAAPGWGESQIAQFRERLRPSGYAVELAEGRSRSPARREARDERGADDVADGNQLAARIAEVRAWWGRLAVRERTGATIAAVLLGAYVVFAVAVQPAWRTLRAAPAQLDALDVELQQMRRLAAEASELRATPPINPAQAAAALKAASDRLGDKARLALQGERAVLTLNGVGTEQLRGWLAEVRSGARARPVEANLARAAVGYSGTIVVAIGGAS